MSNPCFLPFVTDFFRNFESYSHDDFDTLDIPYDYDSLMHYEKLAFSKNRQNTIEAIGDANRPLGQMKRFSEQDIRRLLMAYKCKSIDKDPLPAQPVRSFYENEDKDDNRVILRTKTIREEKRHLNKEEEFVKIPTENKHKDTGHLLYPTKHSSIEKEHKRKEKYQQKISKGTQNQESAVNSTTVKIPERNIWLPNQISAATIVNLGNIHSEPVVDQFKQCARTCISS